MLTELYYWMYRIINRNKSNKEPELNAFFLFSLLECINIFTLWGFLNYFLDITVPKNTAMIINFLVILVILVINFIFLYRKRTKIIKKMEELSNKRRIIGKFLFVLYNLVTLFLMFYVVYYLVKVRY